MATTTNLSPVTTGVYAAAIDAVSIDPTDIPATINAAAAIGCADRLGSLEPGKQADLLILNVADYRHLGYRFGENLVSQVVKRGIFHPVG